MAFFNDAEICRNPVIIFGRHENEGVEGIDLCSPLAGMRLGVFLHHGGGRFIEERQPEFRNVDQFKPRIAALAGDSVNPPRNGFGAATRSGTAEDDGYVDHGLFPVD
jgi:hypothetical protein